MDILSFATSEILKMRISSRKEMTHENSTSFERTVLGFYRMIEPCVALLSHYLFHLNISCDYELSKVQKGFPY